MRRSHQENTTVKLSGKGGRKLTASALLQRDPQFLNWNRIQILGSHDVMTQAMTLQGRGTVQWEIHNRTDWPGADEIKHYRSGSGFIRTTGMSQGVSIADDSIQPVAELAIYELVESFQGDADGNQSAEYWFLQRSRHWPVYPNPFRQYEGRRVSERWIRVGSANLRFRLISTTHLRDDERISREVERLVIPGVEIEPIGGEGADPEFQSRAEALWFALRVLLTFGLRQYVHPLAEFVGTDGTHKSTWHTVELAARPAKSDDIDAASRPHLFQILPKATSKLFKIPEHRELMHAAAYGYASSFDSLTLESGLTSCVQAIERLVTVFEATRNLDPELLDRKAWKPLAKSLKGHVETLILKPTVEARVKRTLSMPMKLSLQERIERMARSYRRTWDSSAAMLLNGVDNMIKARNDIVHGRMISDSNVTYVERLRARALFEKLFLCFLGCGKVHSSSHASMEISHHYGIRTNRSTTRRNSVGVSPPTTST